MIKFDTPTNNRKVFKDNKKKNTTTHFFLRVIYITATVLRPMTTAC